MDPQTAPESAIDRVNKQIKRLSSSQVEAFGEAVNYISFQKMKEKIFNDTDQYLVIDGEAGTGKTLLIQTLFRFCRLNDSFPTIVSFTGRGAGNVSSNDIPAQTAHSLLYEPVLDEWGNVLYWKKLPSDVIRGRCGDFIIVEEASMMPVDMVKEIMSICLPIVFVGDSGQLLPVSKDEENIFVTEQFNPEMFINIKVKDVQRHDGGILELARLIKSIGNINQENRKLDGVEFLDKSNFNYKWIQQHHHDVDMFACFTNNKRRSLNNLIRIAKGFRDEIPEPGERVVCLKNTVINHIQIYNGELFEVKEVFQGNPVSTFIVDSIDEDNKQVTVKVDNNFWMEETYQDFQIKQNTQGIAEFTFGYCLSVHKLQGSTFNTVCYFDEFYKFAPMKRLRYTAFTRAAEKLFVVK